MLGSLLVWVFAGVCPDAAGQVVLSDLTPQLTIVTTNERTSLDRVTRQLISTVDVTIRNPAADTLLSPLHLVAETDSDRVVVRDAFGGPSDTNYHAFYLDLSASLSNGVLRTGNSIAKRVTFVRDSGVAFHYAFKVRSRLNQDPLVDAGGPYTARTEAPLEFDASGSTDPDGQPVQFHWDFGDGSTSTGAAPVHAFSSLGIFNVTLRVEDGVGGSRQADVLVPVLPEGSFALARVRSVDDVGHPLPDVAIEEQGPLGSRALRTDARFGFATVGQGAGEHGWLFSQPGHHAVWRSATLAPDAITVIPSPWLPRRAPIGAVFSPIQPGELLVSNAALFVSLSFPAGSFQQFSDAALTPLSSQTLPGLLPHGWSPLRAFWLDLSTPAETNAAGAAQFSLDDGLPVGVSGAFAHWSDATRAWIVQELIAGTGTNVASAALPGAGVYALLRGDAGATAPPAPVLGQPLAPFAGGLPALAGLTSTGVVVPAVSAASKIPEAVTALATATFSGPGPLPSGALFLCNVADDYALVDGTARKPAGYETSVAAFQFPGDRDPNTLHARFPLRPQLLLEARELREATVKADVQPPQAFSGGAVDENGGVVQGPGVQLNFDAGDVAELQLVEILPLDSAGFAQALGSNATIALAFELRVDGLATGSVLEVSFGALQPHAHYVLARVLASGGAYGLQPLARFNSGADGVPSSVEPTAGERLPGMTGAGRYVLVHVADRQGLVTGVTRRDTAQPAPGLHTRLTGLPWFDIADASARYRLVAPTGGVHAVAVDPLTVEMGVATGVVTDPELVTVLDITLTAEAPRIASITPADGTTGVRRVTSVTVQFSEPIVPATFAGNGLALLEAGSNAVPGALALDLDGLTGRFYPQNPLTAATLYTVNVSPALTDRGGLPIEGGLTFTFTTESVGTRGAGAQLVIFEPGATNCPCTNGVPGYVAGDTAFVCVEGSQGTADPGVPVILVNDTTGETATTLANPDGSCRGFIRASEDDYVSIVFINANGTRISVPAVRQFFDNGAVGLYKSGGTIFAESDAGPVEFTVEPNAIVGRTKFKVSALTPADVTGVLSNAPPVNASLINRGMVLSFEGDSVEGDIDVAIPVTLAELEALGLPSGGDPNGAAFMLVMPVSTDTGVVYLAVDSMEYENGKLVTHSPPFPGASYAMNITSLARNTAAEGSQLIRELANDPDFQHELQLTMEAMNLYDMARGGVFGASIGGVSYLAGATANMLAMMPLQMAVRGQPITFTGKVLDVKVGDQNQIISERGLGAATVTVSPIGAGLFSSARPGRLDPGTVYTMSARNGHYALKLPMPILGNPFDNASDEDFYALSATHPRYFGLRVTQVPPPPIVGFSLADLIFVSSTNAAGGNSSPSLTISHVPFRPAVDAVATLSVLSTHAASRPQIVVQTDSVKLLADGSAGSLSDLVTISNTVENVGNTAVREIHYIRCSSQSDVKFKVTSTVNGVPPSEMFYVIRFGGVEPPVVNPKNADHLDRVGPFVIDSFPSSGAHGFAPGETIHLRFSEAIDGGITNNLSPIQLQPAAGDPALSLSPDQRSLSLTYYKLQPGVAYTLTASSGIKDISPNANRLDQDRTTDTPDLFVLDLETAPMRYGTFGGMDYGGGSVTRGIYAYVLERQGPLDGAVVVYDLSNPAAPMPVGSLSVPGFPRDLAIIPSYSFRTDLTGAVRTQDLLAVVGGKVGGSVDEFGKLLGGFQYLWIIDIANPLAPTRLASAVVVLSSETVVSRVQWSPPILSYLESSSPAQNIGLVDLQTFILGSTLPGADFVPGTGNPGKDANGDGDYVDVGDEMPVPGISRTSFAGKVFAFAVTDTSQRIEDYLWDSFNGYLGFTLTAGHELGNLGQLGAPVDPCYRTFYYRNDFLERPLASVGFPGERPKRLNTIFGVPVTAGDQARLANLAMVSVHPGGNSTTSRLDVIDITDPLAPTNLTSISVDPQHGLVQSAILREDGLILLACSSDTLVLNPFRFSDAPTLGSPHPALVGVIPGGGSGARTFGGVLAGFNVVSSGGKNMVVQTPPVLSIVGLRDFAPFDPSTLAGDAALTTQMLAAVEYPNLIQVSRYRPFDYDDNGVTKTNPSLLDPPSPLTHYYVLVYAPGSAGSTIELALESLNEAGFPLRSKGLGFPPVRAMAGTTVNAIGQAPGSCDLTPDVLKAYRVSHVKGNPNYNLYVSEPFALMYEPIRETELIDLKSPLAREILWSGHQVRVCLEHTMDGNVAIGPYAAAIGTGPKRLRPGPFAAAPSLPADYLMGPNPPPVSEVAFAPGTFGMIAAHNGELRTETIDIDLPSRRMPIVFQRAIGGQDLYDGPMGRGWDHIYNQRLIELKAGYLPPGQKVPLILRGGDGDEIAADKDVMFVNGLGRVIYYEFVGSNPPPDYAQDPVATTKGWLASDVAAGFYLPTEGVFDMLIHFRDGKFVRLTPEGTEFWYSPNGKLESVYDRYEDNYHVLAYNDRGELTRITDESVTIDRYLDIGYWRLAGDAPGPRDEVTAEVNKAGRIRRLYDYTGRDVLFDYTPCGELEHRDGVEIKTAHPGGFRGRARTTYILPSGNSASDRANGIEGAIAGSTTGGALFDGSFTQQSGYPVATGGTGAGGGTQVTVSHPNTAEAVAQGGGSTTITTVDGATSQLEFDANGRTKTLTRNGSGALQNVTRYEYTNGLISRIEFPEGNSIALTYDGSHANLRSRANLLTSTFAPGTRGGDPIQPASFAYDDRYNVPLGAQTDYAGDTATVTLTGDRKEIAQVTYSGVVGTETRSFNSYGQLEVIQEIDGTQRTLTHNTRGFAETLRRGDLPPMLYQYLGGAGDRGNATGIILPRGMPLTLEFNERNQLITRSRGSVYEKFALDRNGHPVRITRSVASGVEQVIRRSYHDVGFLLSETQEKVETEGGLQDLTISYTPDAMFRVVAVELPGTVKREYLNLDHMGRPQGMRFGAYEESYGYDLNGNLRSVTRGGAVESFAYDGYDRLTTRAMPAAGGAEITGMRYHPRGELRHGTVADASSNVVREVLHEVDALGRVTKFTLRRSGGDAVTDTAYDGNQRTVTVTDPALEVTTLAYDRAGRTFNIDDSVSDVTLQLDSNDNVERVTSVEVLDTYFDDFTPYNGLDQSTRRADAVGDRFTISPRFDGAVESLTDARSQVYAMTFSVLGEPLKATRPSGVTVEHAYNNNRLLAAIKDTESAGLDYTYDTTLRPSQQLLRDGSPVNFSQYDIRNNLPEQMSMPGNGSVSATYDEAGRRLTRNVSFNGTVRAETHSHDAMGRGTASSFPFGSVTYAHDPLDVELTATRTLRGGTYVVNRTYRADSARLTIDYPTPDGIFLTESRDPAGRLLGIAGSVGGTLVGAVTFAAADLVSEMELGTNLVCASTYDLRKRLVRRAYTAKGKSRPLIDIRYAYDPTDNVVARQEVHRGARALFARYDEDNRIDRSDVDARPRVSDEISRALNGFVVPPEVSGNWSSGRFGRTFQYDGSDLDLMDQTSPINPDGLALPAFAEDYGGHDGFLNILAIDGFARGSDALGFVNRHLARARPTYAGVPVPRALTLVHDGVGNLVGITNSVGDVLAYDYDDRGYCFHRRLALAGGATLQTTFVYDGPRLIAEYDRGTSGGANTLQARYLYAGGDVPMAMDRRSTNGVLERYYLLSDSLGSVAGLADKMGTLVERYGYDAWGQPSINERDTEPPRVVRIEPHPEGFVVIWSEPVLPPPSASGGGIVTALETPAGVVELVQNGRTNAPRVRLDESAAGTRFGTALRVVTQLLESATCIVTIVPDKLQDDWGNGAISQQMAFVYSFTNPAPFFVGDDRPTDKPERGRSSFGQPFLFHGQYFDYDVGLYYMRGRWYDPGTGLFLERDPEEYTDSVNPYAAFRHNPQTLRDPSGRATVKGPQGPRPPRPTTGVGRPPVKPPVKPTAPVKPTGGRTADLDADQIETTQVMRSPLARRSNDESTEILDARPVSESKGGRQNDLLDHLEAEDQSFLRERVGKPTEDWFRARGVEIEQIGQGADFQVFRVKGTDRAYRIAINEDMSQDYFERNVNGHIMWDTLGEMKFHRSFGPGQLKVGKNKEGFPRRVIEVELFRGFRDANGTVEHGSGNYNGSAKGAIDPTPQQVATAQARMQVHLDAVGGNRGKLLDTHAQWGIDGDGNVRFVDPPKISNAELMNFLSTGRITP